MKAPFGWTIVRRGGWEPYHVYKRDCPPPADLCEMTFPTRREAQAEADKRNELEGKLYAQLAFSRPIAEGT